MYRRIIFLTLFCLVIAIQVHCQKKINVLFLGNSLTYSNNLPELVKKVAACDSVEITYQSISFPNYALVDHWDDGNAQQEIKSGKYNFVIVQQGPSSQTEGRTYLLDYGLKFDSICDQNNAKIVSYMVWPSKARSEDFPGVFESYKLLAEAAHGIFCPAGNAWLQVWASNPNFKLYDEDNFHPSYRGSLLAAMVIYGSIMQKQNLTFVQYEKLKTPQLTKPDFKILVRAAQRVLTHKKR